MPPLLPRSRGASAPASNELAKLRKQTTRLRAERDLLQVQLRTMAAAERSVVPELHRLREAAFGEPGRERTGTQPRYLFVVSVGRTGSTLVQGVLNSVPGIVIRGENGGFLCDLFELHRRSLRHRDRLARDNKLMRATNAWWGMDGYPEDLALREFRHLATDLLLRPGPDTHTVGFKEISWPDGEALSFIAFMRQVFPGARFILSSRRLEDVATSGFWANRPDAMPRLAVLDASVRAAMANLGNDAFEIRYEDVADRADGFRPLFEWLDVPFERHVVAAVTSQRHSYAPREGASPEAPAE